MKRILCVLFLLSSMNAIAKETVQVVFPFLVNPTFGYKIIEEANKIQDNWHFIIVTKPGAGGEIAANAVASSKTKALLATNSSFFIRSAIYANSNYAGSQFALIIPQCAVPIVVISKKYKSFSDINKNQRLTIGVTGLGTTTHIVALELTKQFPNIVEIPYNGISDTLKAVLSNEVDLSVGFLKQWQGTIESGSVTALGITGNISYLNIPTLTGMTSISNNFFLAAHKDIAPQIYEEWKKIFEQVNASSTIQTSYKDEFCTPIKSSSTWITDQQQHWKKLTKDIKVEQ